MTPRFLVLGPPAVRTVDGRAVTLTGRRDRAILAALLARRNRTVPVDVLAEAGWGADDGWTPNALQARISHLRRLVGADRIVREGRHYLLRTGSGEGDDDVLREALDRARGQLAANAPKEAVAALEEGLALVRGEPYEGVAACAAVAPAAARLRELLVTAREVHARAVLEAGDAGGAVDLAAALVAEDPLRQHAQAVLVEALDRDGRRAEALAGYERARRVLAGSAGLEPAPELRAVQARILADERSSARPEAAGPGVLQPPDMIRWLARHGHRQAAVDLAVRCAWGWWLAGDRGRGRRLLLDLLDDRPGSLTARLWAAALAAHDRDEPAALAEVRTLLDGHLAGGERIASSHDGLALLVLADRHAERGEPDRATALLAAARPAVEAVDDPWGTALDDLVHARVRLAAGRADEAQSRAAAALAVFESLPDAAGRMRALEVLGYLDEVAGDLGRAARRYGDALLLAVQGGWPHAQCHLSVRLGSVADLLGDHAGGRQRLAEATALARRVGSPSLLAWAVNTVALADARAGDHPAAERGHRQALGWYRYAGSVAGVAMTAAALARVSAPARAEVLLDQAERAAVATRDPRAVAYVVEGRALVARTDERARHFLALARRLRAEAGRPRVVEEQPALDRLEQRLGVAGG
ncbi:BTAD domain-containing putative transcriptional regulator [Pseudonocardia lutea]|uniref:BTAD domain-containing putative transcriptional regulator n=1 Tax=Pseudonocardia lutea TaxID=2172015 RepID=A0ABW1ID48_9PSEU